MTKVHHHTGEEGPHCDPYHYDEVEVARNGHTYVGHFGLAEWVKVDGVKVESDNSHELFKELTGAYYEHWIQWLQKSKSRCKCGSKKFYWASGFPGESLKCCQKCHDVIDYHMNWAAIE